MRTKSEIQADLDRIEDAEWDLKMKDSWSSSDSLLSADLRNRRQELLKELKEARG